MLSIITTKSNELEVLKNPPVYVERSFSGGTFKEDTGWKK